MLSHASHFQSVACHAAMPYRNTVPSRCAVKLCRHAVPSCCAIMLCHHAVQGWRLEVKEYPRLTEHGAWRGREGSSYGGFYSQDEVCCQLCNMTLLPSNAVAVLLPCIATLLDSRL